MKRTIREILAFYKIKPKKSLGQNFLVDKFVLRRIIQVAEIKESDFVLEIGAGLGFLTELLAKRAKKVIAVEKDKNLVKILRERLENFNNIEIIEADVLELQTEKILPEKYKVIGNLPYNIALAVIRKFLEERKQPQEMFFLIQKEVAQKICSKKSSLPKIAVEFYAKTKILFYVKKDCFFPKPKVDGAIIKITKIRKGIPGIDKDLFFKVVRAGFAHPRKTILNNLSSELKLEKKKVRDWLKKSGVNPKNRPEDLKLKDWLNLLLKFKFNS
jgi:16S rRNA (adenine1518-N6/adenine1519-N6)-dimethyltransferase